MVGLFSLCLALFLATDSVLLANAATTAMPGNQTHHHHENTEIENFSFNYDGTTKMLLVLANTKCYIWSLNPNQLQSVHTDNGLRSIELQVMGDIDKAMYTVVPQGILATSIQHACGRHTNTFYLVH